MSNAFINIPVPAANGSGAAVDLSSMGAGKTLSVTGAFVASVTLEISNEDSPTQWAPVQTFTNPDGLVVQVACHWMRATVSGYASGTPACDVGSTDDGATFANLPVTAGNGSGAAVDVSALGTFKTITVGGAFGGNVQIETSEDGSTKWSQIGFGYQRPGQQSAIINSHWMRATRGGVPLVGSAGTPLVDVAGCSPYGGAPSGGGTLFPVTALWEADFSVTMFHINQVDPTALAAGDVTGTLPVAGSVPNGAWTRFAVFPAATGGNRLLIRADADAGDTIGDAGATLAFTFASDTLSIELVSDGVSNWVPQAQALVSTIPVTPVQAAAEVISGGGFNSHFGFSGVDHPGPGQYTMTLSAPIPGGMSAVVLVTPALSDNAQTGSGVAISSTQISVSILAAGAPADEDFNVLVIPAVAGT